MALNRTFTAPLAIIKVQPATGPLVAVGKMKNIRVTETINRGRVIGLGNLTPDELPATGWSGTLSCSFYMIDFSQNPIVSALLRKVGATNLPGFIDTLLLAEQGLIISIQRRVANGAPDPVTGIQASTLAEFATIRDLVINRESFDVSESQIAGRDADFDYKTPILFDI